MGAVQDDARGSHYDIGGIHFWLGIALAIVVVGACVIRFATIRRGAATHGPVLLAAGTLALVGVFVQGYLGGRLTYDRGVGVQAAGEFAQTAKGVSALNAALAKGTSAATAGKAAFSDAGLGCASCHSDQAQGQRGPSLAGGRGLEDFRRVHENGLFPPAAVSDRDFQAIDAWLRTLRRSGGGRDEG